MARIIESAILRSMKSLDTSVLIVAVATILSIRKPIEFRIGVNTKQKFVVKNAAACYKGQFRKGDLYKHIIYVNTDLSVNLMAQGHKGFALSDLVCHELIHAAMMEHGSFNSGFHHCEKFQAAAILLRKELNKLGFSIGPLYNPETDTE